VALATGPTDEEEEDYAHVIVEQDGGTVMHSNRKWVMGYLETFPQTSPAQT